MLLSGELATHDASLRRSGRRLLLFAMGSFACHVGMVGLLQRSLGALPQLPDVRSSPALIELDVTLQPRQAARLSMARTQRVPKVSRSNATAIGAIMRPDSVRRRAEARGQEKPDSAGAAPNTNSAADQPDVARNLQARPPSELPESTSVIPSEPVQSAGLPSESRLPHQQHDSGRAESLAPRIRDSISGFVRDERVNGPPVIPDDGTPPIGSSGRLAADIRKSARADCRTAYGGLGLLAIPMLLADAMRTEGCKW